MIDLESTIRTITPAETLSKILPLCWEPFGITRIANITGLDKIGIPVYISIRPNGKSLSVSQGKGISDELAKISAIMESIEIWHAENIPASKITFNGAYTALSDHEPVIDPDIFIIDPEHHSLQKTNLDWLNAYDVLQQTNVYLPYQLFSLDTTALNDINQQFSPSTNGLASGNSYEEAFCHGLCELIERDAVARWLQLSETEQDNTLLTLDSIQDGSIAPLIKKIKRADLDLYIWDIRNHFDIPAYYCAIADSHQSPFTLFTGSGAHFTQKVALLRAITEAAQARLTYISGSRDDVFPKYYREFDPSKVVTQLKTVKPHKKYVGIPANKFLNFNEANQFLLAQLSINDINQLYAVNHTRSNLNISVVHVLAPQLQGGK